jgi:hypothetical protein
MRIDLAEYAQEGGLSEDSTLLSWIAHKVSMRSNAGEVKPSVLQSWMKQWPWFLVLDGLDEVTEPTVRKRLIQRVTEFVNDAEAENCDVFVVLTTRPIGYTENVAPTQFERIDLDYLEPAEAVRYGTLATGVRLRGDVDRIEKVVKQLKQAAEDEALRNLLRTPLQVLILTIIVDGAGQVAPDRYSLFWGYFETVFKRERDKQGGLHHMLREYGQQIQLLHERVGFELQVRSEAGDRSYATLTAGVDLVGTPDVVPLIPPYMAVWRSVRSGGDTKTKKSRRTLALPQRCVDALRAHEIDQAKDRTVAGERWQDQGLVFASKVGTPLDPSHVRRDFRAAIAGAVGVEAQDWTPRELRHSFVSLLSDNGVPLEEISRFVGHSSTAVTELVYRKQIRPVMQEGATVMDRIFHEA